MRRPVNFLHIPKTGGTALRHVLDEKIRSGEVIWHNHHARLGDIKQGEPVAFFLHDPLGRYLSGFNSRYRRGKPRYECAPWTPVQARLFEAFPTANALAESLFAPDEAVRVHAASAFSIIQTMLPYSFYFRDMDEIRARWPDILFIGLQERLQNDSARFCSALGLIETSVLPDDDVLAHRAPVGQSLYLSELAVRNLRRYLDLDFQIYSKLRLASLAR